MGTLASTMCTKEKEGQRVLFIRLGSTTAVPQMIILGTLATPADVKKILSDCINASPDNVRFRDCDGNLFIFEDQHLTNSEETAYTCECCDLPRTANDGAVFKDGLSATLLVQKTLLSTNNSFTEGPAQ